MDWERRTVTTEMQMRMTMKLTRPQTIPKMPVQNDALAVLCPAG
jgi:hypothetical protein